MSDTETEELAWELQQERPDTQRIKWLVVDMAADLQSAMARANMKEVDLHKRPDLRPLRLQDHLKKKIAPPHKFSP